MSSNESSSNGTDRVQLFGDSTEDMRRSILFSIGIVTGFIAMVATSALAAAGDSVITIIVLGLLAVLAFVFAGSVYTGRFDSLVEDEQLLWRIVGDEE